MWSYQFTGARVIIRSRNSDIVWPALMGARKEFYQSPRAVIMWARPEGVFPRDGPRFFECTRIEAQHLEDGGRLLVGQWESAN